MTTLPVPWIVKAGGRELRPGAALRELAARLAEGFRAGLPTVVVHGGGDEITARADALGLPTERLDGQRVTDPAMLEVVQEVLGGRINGRLVGALRAEGIEALGLTGVSAGLLHAEPISHPKGSLGLVGSPKRVGTDALHRLLDAGFLPVLAPLALGPDGGVLNVNADLTAGAIAAALRGDLALLTDVPGVRDASGRTLAHLRLDELPGFLASGAATAGMLPKLEGAAMALRDGAASVWIGDLAGLRRPGLPDGPGTRIVRAAVPARLSVPRSPRSRR